MQSVVARLTETPTNFHQATVHFLATDAPEDAAMARKAPLLYAGSMAMVGLQSMTAMGVLVGTVLPSCATSDQCGAGAYCWVHRGRCDYCGGGVPLPLAVDPELGSAAAATTGATAGVSAEGVSLQQEDDDQVTHGAAAAASPHQHAVELQARMQGVDEGQLELQGQYQRERVDRARAAQKVQAHLRGTLDRKAVTRYLDL